MDRNFRTLVLLSGLLPFWPVNCTCASTPEIPADSSSNISSKPPSHATPTLRIFTSTGAVVFELEVARTPAEQSKGLQNRASLPPTQGMLFIFSRMGRPSFWMKDTLISLDLIYFDKDWHIVGIVENAVPLSEKLINIDREFMYVLEINGGKAKQNNINIGQNALFQP